VGSRKGREGKERKGEERRGEEKRGDEKKKKRRGCGEIRRFDVDVDEKVEKGTLYVLGRGKTI